MVVLNATNLGTRTLDIGIKGVMAKTAHLIRHGQSTFNAAIAESGVDPMHRDARLTPLGHRQVAAARPAIASVPYRLVVTSPLTRAIETCLGLFSGQAVPIVVEALHREYQEESCDIGRSPEELAAEFPALSFAHLDDPWWRVGTEGATGVPVETFEQMLDRVAAFSEWLAGRPENPVAVIGHSCFFYHLCGRSLDNCEVHAIEL